VRSRLLPVCVGLAFLAGAVVVGIGLLTGDQPDDTGVECIERDGTVEAAPPTDASLRGSPSTEPTEPVVDPAIRGRVVDARTGEPVPDVPVLVLRTEDAFDQGPDSPVLFERRSGEDGAFVVARIGPEHGEVTLLAMGNGWVAEAATHEPPQDPRDPAWCVKLREGETVAAHLRVVRAARVEGHVLLPDGEPAVGATVGAPQAPNDHWEGRRRRNAHRRLARAVADADGRFVLDSLAPRREVYLDARLDGHCRVLSDALELEPGETTTITFHLTSPRRAIVEVVSTDDGSPIGGALVRIHQYGASPVGISRIRTLALTDEDGLARLSALPPEEFHLRVERNGFLPFRSRGKDARTRLFSEEPPGTFRTRVELEPVAWVSGRVVVAGIERVEAEQIWVSVGALDAPGYEKYSHAIATGVPPEPDGPGIEPDGTFRIPVPRTGLYVLHATVMDAWMDSEARATLEVRPGQSGIEIPLTLPREVWPGVPVDWWVLDLRMPDGSQAVDASFEVQDEGLDDEEDFYEGLAGREEVRAVDGSWNIPVRKNSPGLWISIQGEGPPGVQSGRRMYGPFETGGGRRTIQFPPAGVIRGRALLPDGSPLIGVEIQGWAAELNRSYRAMRAFATTDGDGTFLLTELGEDDYELRMKGEGPWLPARRITVPPGTEDVLLQTHPVVSATVTVLLPTGEPAHGASVSASPVGADRTSRVSNWSHADEDGRVLFERLQEGGTYILSAGHGTHRGTIRDWTPGETTLRLGTDLKWRKVAGRVVDRDGAPVRDAWVGLVDARGSWSTTQTYGSGAFSFWLGRSGTGRLVAAWTRGGLKADDARPSREVKAGDTDVDLVLPSLRELDVQVTGLSSRRVDRLDLKLVPLDPAGEFDDRLTSEVEDGKAHFRGLEPERRYVLWGRLSGLDWYVHEEVNAKATSATATLKRGGVIGGRVLAPAGSYDQVRVNLLGPGFWLWAERTRDGRFTIHAVPDGEWTVQGERYFDGAWHPVSVQARAGDVVEIDLRSP
jgi:protocatechuate 3,4-dioxygenase beta subunit